MMSELPHVTVGGLCDKCGVAIKPGRAYSYREVTGFEEVSRTGGAGRLAERQYTGRVRCRTCQLSLTDGGQGQLTLRGLKGAGR